MMFRSFRWPAWLIAAAVMFMVVSDEQLEAARAVSGHLPSPPTVVNPYTGVAQPLDQMESVQRPVGFVITPRAIHNARTTLRRAMEMSGSPHPVLVVGQDVGTIERVGIASARKGGARLAIMPDGVFSSARLTPAMPRPMALAIDAADRTLVAAGILAGRRSDFGSSEPDMILSWGPGWEGPMHRRVPGALIANTGSPRSDSFAALPARPGTGNLLVCSQPLSLTQSAAPAREVAAWYDWLTTMARVEDPRVRVRLHPGERAPRYRLPDGLQRLLAEPQRPLAGDLAWADAVLAPYSSVLVEAVGASRVPISAGSTEIWGDFAANAFLQDPRVPSVDFRTSPGLDALLDVAAAAAPEVDALRDDYLAHVGDASRLTADAIMGLATQAVVPAPEAARQV